MPFPPGFSHVRPVSAHSIVAVKEPRRTLLRGAGLVPAAGRVAAAGVVADPLATLRRLTDEPLLAPQGSGFESAGVFNPAAMQTSDGIVL